MSHSLSIDFRSIVYIANHAQNYARSRKRLNPINATRREMEQMFAETAIPRALKSRLPPATTFNFQLGHYVRMYRKDIHK